MLYPSSEFIFKIQLLFINTSIPTNYNGETFGTFFHKSMLSLHVFLYCMI